MKYGLMKYDHTMNLGNEVQSIAARQFLPKIDYEIDHEHINEFSEDKNVKIIINGYFLDCLKAWPPSENLNPLLISMHFNSWEEIQKVILSKDSKDYFNEYGPVGCRDTYTEKFLNDNGIEAYYSGCLTLTLNPGNNQKHLEDVNEYILVNCDESDEVISYLKTKTDKTIYKISQEVPPGLHKAYLNEISRSLYNYTTYFNSDEKFFYAENLLKIYENASCVITDRLHCALPCLALKTPVLLFNTRIKQERFAGLKDLLLVSKFKEYSDNYDIFDVNNPPENSDEYLRYKKSLTKTCKKFTGYMSDSCYLSNSYNDLLDKSTLLCLKQSRDTRDYIGNVLDKSKGYERKIKRQNKKIKQKDKTIKQKNKIIKEQEKIIYNQKKLIEEMKNSNSWKLTEPLRKLRR